MLVILSPKITSGLPSESLKTSISLKANPLMPVPNALLTASFTQKDPAIVSFLKFLLLKSSIHQHIRLLCQLNELVKLDFHKAS